MPHLTNTAEFGPVQLMRREQIMAAAHKFIRDLGYEKTTVTDLANAIGLSKSYVHRFFSTKQDLGEAVCLSVLTTVANQVRDIAIEAKPASDRLHRIILHHAREAANLYLRDRNMHDLAVTSFRENWQSSRLHDAELLSIFRLVLRDGRAAGEFELGGPIDQTARAILIALRPFQPSALLRYSLDTLVEDSELAAGLILRSLLADR